MGLTRHLVLLLCFLKIFYYPPIAGDDIFAVMASVWMCVCVLAKYLQNGSMDQHKYFWGHARYSISKPIDLLTS